GVPVHGSQWLRERSSILRAEGVRRKRLECSVENGATRLRHQPNQKPHVVQAGEPHSQLLASAKQVVKVAKRELGAGGAAAFGIDRRLAQVKSGLTQIDLTLACEDGAGSTQPGRQYTVEQ